MKYHWFMLALLAAPAAWATHSPTCTTPVHVCPEAMAMPSQPTEVTLTDGTVLRFVPACTYGMSGGVMYDVFAITDQPCSIQKLSVESYDGENDVTQDVDIGCKDIWQDDKDPDLIHCSDGGYRPFTYEPGILRLETQVEFTPGEGPDAAMDEKIVTVYTRKRK